MTDQEKMEIDARIEAIMAQRNSAMNDFVVLAGRMQVLSGELKKAQERIAELESSHSASKASKKEKALPPEKTVTA